MAMLQARTCEFDPGNAERAAEESDTKDESDEAEGRCTDEPAPFERPVDGASCLGLDGRTTDGAISTLIALPMARRSGVAFLPKSTVINGPELKADLKILPNDSQSVAGWSRGNGVDLSQTSLKASASIRFVSGDEPVPGGAAVQTADPKAAAAVVPSVQAARAGGPLSAAGPVGPDVEPTQLASEAIHTGLTGDDVWLSRVPAEAESKPLGNQSAVLDQKAFVDQLRLRGGARKGQHQSAESIGDGGRDGARPLEWRDGSMAGKDIAHSGPVVRAAPVLRGAAVVLTDLSANLSDVEAMELLPTSGGAERSLNVAPADTGPNRPQTPLLAQHVARQMSVSLHRQGEGTTEVALDPVELGRVRMRVTVLDQTVTMVVVADRPETADLMRRHVDVLQQEFKGLGYTSVTLAFGSGQDRSAAGSGGRAVPEGGLLEGTSSDEAVSAVPVRPPPRLTVDGSLDLRL
ncbi:flagellar hook-length control protein FliK [Loktanella atrilutea]|nr:flagellar hook-length control protein FliK [Loktanella atrilutea]